MPQQDRARSSSFSPEETLNEILAAAGSSALDDEGDNISYDHSQCSDCSLVYDMANECAMHLAASQHFAQEGSVRLQRLNNIRAQINERVHQLEETEFEGNPFSHHE